METPETVSRRTILKGTVAGAIGIGALSGTASAKSCSCPSGTRLVAKFENNEGSLDFEKTETRMSPASNFTFSNKETKEGEGAEEIIYLEWDSYPYTITNVTFGTGNGCHSGTINSDGMSGSIKVTDGTALSNIEFCAPAFWQVDFANTTSPPSIPYKPAEFIEALVGSSAGLDRKAENNRSSWFTSDPNLALSGSSSSVSFTVAGELPYANGNLSLASFDAPAILPKQSDAPDLWDAIVAEQVLYDEDHDTFGDGDSGPLSVSLPTV